MSPEKSLLQREIRQRKPFHSPAQEATVGILRTADLLRRHVGRVIERYGITHQQYNVLRILRGAHPDPLPTLEIGERMIEQTPGVTRLIDRLEAKGLVRRERCTDDRRLVHCRITEEGLGLLREMDGPVDEADERLLEGLGEEEVRQLVSLLDRIRSHPG